MIEPRCGTALGHRGGRGGTARGGRPSRDLGSPAQDQSDFAALGRQGGHGLFDVDLRARRRSLSQPLDRRGPSVRGRPRQAPSSRATQAWAPGRCVRRSPVAPRHSIVVFASSELDLAALMADLRDRGRRRCARRRLHDRGRDQHRKARATEVSWLPPSGETTSPWSRPSPRTSALGCARPAPKSQKRSAVLDDRPHRILLLLTDGLAGDQQEIVRGAYSVVGAGVPLVGGCAGDDQHMKIHQRVLQWSGSDERHRRRGHRVDVPLRYWRSARLASGRRADPGDRQRRHHRAHPRRRARARRLPPAPRRVTRHRTQPRSRASP